MSRVFYVQPYEDRSSLPNICSSKGCLNSAPKHQPYCDACEQKRANKKPPNKKRGRYRHSVTDLCAYAPEVETIYFVGANDLVKIGDYPFDIPNMEKHTSQDRPVEVTPAMIEAGEAVYYRFDPTADDPTRFLFDVFCAMYLAREKPFSVD